MAVATVATSSLHLACSSSAAGESKVLSRRGPCLLAPAPGRASPLKLVSNGSRVSMSADGKKEISLAAPAALAVLAAAVIPDMAEAVAPGVSPSLKNLLLSVVAGGVVLVAIGGAVAAVSTFDPVKRK
ncbi:hypothetical protein GOP47_0014166 [Adiantum capillus-veneris]|uniref:Ultraviolet-B-repressible protein n=1 Tax=Adiantum capillus-veneris TaxID=13818 RepID=A0A9D4UQ75_ADICA|nr:hypothetical protein GOP47_0013720 [Adiantum capillus-veneris]KAI5071915.1 hypothetical protein GOP47_0014166 [Adiantum capillus-veneris]